jgi:hypothetical protein
MFIVLLLNGIEWCEMWSKGSRATTKGLREFEAKHSSWFCIVFFPLYRWHLEWLR